jgi:signal transduction histidine kinase
MVTMAFLVILLNALFIHAQQQTITGYMIKEGMVLADLLADNVRLGVFSENRGLIAAQAATVLRQDKVLEILVFDKNGNILLAKRRSDAESESLCVGTSATFLRAMAPEIRDTGAALHDEGPECLVFGAPVQTIAAPPEEELYFNAERTDPAAKELIGFVTVAFNRQSLDKSLYNVLLDGLTIGAVFMLLVLVATYLIVLMATRPLNRLVRMVKGSDVQAEAADEIGLLSESFSAMLARLTSSFATIGRLKSELEEMTREVLKTQEQEKQRLAFDLHDNVAQELSALKIFCAGLPAKWPDAPQPVVDQLDFMEESLKRCINTVRELSYDLRPPGLTQLGLGQTIAQLCEDFRGATGIEVDFLATGFGNVEPDYNVAINCYRIIQEALNNIKKHARANRVEIRLLESFPRIILRIRDDGVGFDMEARAVGILKERRMGLNNMGKRAALLNGKITIDSHLGQGTRILVELPSVERSDELPREEYPDN